ncbi:MAG: class I SAM-dependent methyltransferase [Kiritimatiellaeota bacterium]|nr:class I SAM-dependent methyltransferase [Kiritimatiellota bacterium]
MSVRRYWDCARLNARVTRLLLTGRWLQKDDIARSYDRLASAYDEAWLVYLQGTTARLLGLLPGALPQGAVLDVGCGTGFACRWLARRYPSREIRACDISGGMLAEARRLQPSPQVTWAAEDMLAFLRRQPDGSAALVTAAWSAGYSDYRRVFREARRVLCGGGRLALVVNLADTLAPLRRAFRYCMQAHAGEVRCLARFPFPRDAGAVRSALAAAGFAVEAFEDGACPVAPQVTPDGRRLPWLLRTGTLAGFDAMLPLDGGAVAETFEARLAADPEPIAHHYALGVGVRP